MRESMFSILGNISGLAFLDLFTGSGVVGIEAASRGAEPVVLVEKDRRKAEVIRKNISMVETKIDLRLTSAEGYLKRPPRSFDLVYLDPPFAYQPKTKLLKLTVAGAILSPGGLLLIHYPSPEELPEQIDDLVLVDHRRYGGSSLAFYRLQ